MTATLTTIDDILKEVYGPQLVDQLQSEAIAIKRIERTSDGVSNDVGGKYVRFPIRVKRNHGIGARLENEALPAAKSQGYESAELRLKYLYGALELTGPSIELAETNEQAFANNLEQEVSGIKEGLKKDINRQAYGTNTGILATATGAGSTTTFITTNTQYLEIGMIVDVYELTPAISIASAEITAISGSTVTFTPAAAASTASGWTLTRAGSRGKEKTGFDQILNISGSFGSLYNITHAVWTGNIDSTSSALSEGRMINMIDTIRNRGGKTTLLLTSLGVRRAYFNLLTQQRRYTNTVEFTGGFKGLAFTTDNGDVPLISDFDCPPSRMYYLNEDKIKLYQAGDWSFINRDGSNWNRKVTSSGTFDVFQAHLYKYCELGTFQRNTHGVLTNVTEA